MLKKYLEFWISASYVHSIFLWRYVGIPILMPTSSTILNVQLIFDSYFIWTWFGSFSIFAYSKRGSKNLCQNYKVERSITNITCNLYAISAKQSARNTRICGRTKIGFCILRTPLCSHIVACARIFDQKQHNNFAAITVFPRSASL